jgi:hypothetical protein
MKIIELSLRVLEALRIYDPNLGITSALVFVVRRHDVEVSIQPRLPKTSFS